jgi:hypothetical protein
MLHGYRNSDCGGDTVEARCVRLGAIGLLLVVSFTAIDPVGAAQILCPWLDLELAAAQRDERIGLLLRGTDNFHGDAIHVRVDAPESAGVRIRVPVGLVLESGVPEEQDMVVLGLRGRLGEDRMIDPVPVMEIACGETATFILEAYCLDLEKATPSADNAFVAGGLASDAVVAVLGSAPAVGSAISYAIQQAVWVATGDLSLAEVRQEDPVAFDLLTDAGLAASPEISPPVDPERTPGRQGIILLALLGLAAVIAFLLR